jgi:hypothetical protein
MNWHRPVFGTVGLVAVLFGLGLLYVPAVSSAGPIQQALRYVEAVGTTRTLLLTGGGLIGYLAVGLRSPETTAETTVDQFEPERATERPESNGITGAQFDQQVQTAIDDGGEPFADVREQLQQTATSVYADLVGCAEEQAWQAVEDGTWCSDQLAGTFLSTRHSFSLGAQLRLMVFPRRERRRRIEQTVAVIEQVQGR